MNYCNQSEYGKSRIGSLLNLIVIIIRDIITLIVEIIFSILVVYHYNKFKNMSLQKFAAKIDTNSLSNVSNNKRLGNENNTQNNVVQNSVDHLRMVKRKQKHQQLLLMTIILSIFSFVTHMIAAFVFVFLVYIWERKY